MTKLTNMPERTGNLNNNSGGKWARSCILVADTVCNTKEQSTGRPIKVQCQRPQTSSKHREAVTEKNLHIQILSIYITVILLWHKKKPRKFPLAK